MVAVKATWPRRNVIIEKWIPCTVRWFFTDGTSKYEKYTTCWCSGSTFEQVVNYQIKRIQETMQWDKEVLGAKLISVNKVKVNWTA